MSSYAVPHERPHYRKTFAFRATLHGVGYVVKPVAYSCLIYRFFKAPFGNLYEAARLRAYPAHSDGYGGVPVKPLAQNAEIQPYYVSLPENLLHRGHAVHYLFVYRRAEAKRITHVTLERRLCLPLPQFFFRDTLEVHRGDSRRDLFLENTEYLGYYKIALPEFFDILGSFKDYRRFPFQ